jgi:hypothetical protein
MKRRTESVNLSKLCRPSSESKYLPFKREFGAQLDCVTGCMLTMAAGLGSPGVLCHFSAAMCLGWQVYCSGGREIRGREFLA